MYTYVVYLICDVNSRFINCLNDKQVYGCMFLSSIFNGRMNKINTRLNSDIYIELKYESIYIYNDSYMDIFQML